jgi:hypothetical protein
MKENVIGEFWEYLEEEDTKISDKVLAYLNRDELGEIIVSDNVYWLTTNSGRDYIPQYVFDYIDRWMKGRGKEHLFDKDYSRRD